MAGRSRSTGRLSHMAEHLLPVAAGAAAAVEPLDRQSTLPDSRATGLYRTPRLLSNQQMATFLARGFLSLPVDDVAPEVHRALHETAERRWTQSGEDNGTVSAPLPPAPASPLPPLSHRIGRCGAGQQYLASGASTRRCAAERCGTRRSAEHPWRGLHHECPPAHAQLQHAGRPSLSQRYRLVGHFQWLK